MAGAALFSAVVGGLAYGTAKQQSEQQEAKFQKLAQEECLANDPASILNVPKNPTVQEEVDRIRRLNSLQELCAFGLSGDSLRATDAS